MTQTNSRFAHRNPFFCLCAVLSMAGCGADPTEDPTNQGGNGGWSTSGGSAGMGNGGTAGSPGSGGVETGGGAGTGGAWVLPPIVPSSFHFVHSHYPMRSNAIVGLSDKYGHLGFLGKPTPPKPGKEVAHIRFQYKTPTDKIRSMFNNPATAPAYAMIDELASNPASRAYVKNTADQLRTKYPELRGRWGAFIGFGNYKAAPPNTVSWPAAIDALLKADAVLSLELYPSKEEYCKSGNTTKARDLWLAKQFNGTSTLGRLSWLLKRRKALNSKSHITPLLGVGDILVGKTNGAIFIDRMFYVWKHYSVAPSLINLGNGGAGAYKWTAYDPNPANGQLYGVTTKLRDEQFAASFVHYSVQGKTSSRLGQVHCN